MRVALREIKVFDSYKREMDRSSSRMVTCASQASHGGGFISRDTSFDHGRTSS